MSLIQCGKLDLHIDGKKSSKNVIVWTNDKYEAKVIRHNKTDANVQVYMDSSASIFFDFGDAADLFSLSFQPPTEQHTFQSINDDSVIYAVDLLGCIHMFTKPSAKTTSISCSLPVGLCITTDTFLMQKDDQHESVDSPRTPPVPSPPELHKVSQNTTKRKPKGDQNASKTRPSERDTKTMPKGSLHLYDFVGFWKPFYIKNR